MCISEKCSIFIYKMFNVYLKMFNLYIKSSRCISNEEKIGKYWNKKLKNQYIKYRWENKKNTEISKSGPNRSIEPFENSSNGLFGASILLFLFLFFTFFQFYCSWGSIWAREQKLHVPLKGLYYLKGRKQKEDIEPQDSSAKDMEPAKLGRSW